MAIYPHPTKGKGWWQIRLSHGRGKPQENITYEGTKAEAIAFEADLRGIPVESQNQKITDVLGRFLDWFHLENSAAHATAAEASLPRIINRLGNKALIHYRQADYHRYKLQRAKDGVKKRTVNIELGYFRSLLKFAETELGVAIGDLPKLYTKKQTRPPDIQPLSPDEIARLLEQLHGDKKTIAMLYAYCGLRRNEALTLTRGKIDLERKLIFIRGKGDKGRIVPIVGNELLQRLTTDCDNKESDNFLWICKRTKEPYRNIKRSLKAAAHRANITKPVTNHLLRHSSATAAIHAGVNLRSLQMILGHSDSRITERYTHLAAEFLTEECEKLATLHNAAAMSANKRPKKSNVIKLLPR